MFPRTTATDRSLLRFRKVLDPSYFRDLEKYKTRLQLQVTPTTSHASLLQEADGYYWSKNMVAQIAHLYLMWMIMLQRLGAANACVEWLQGHNIKR